MADFYQQKHYQALGGELKKLRLQNQQSIAEVSGSVEIDFEELARYENGEQRPCEEILLLLISHFDLTEDKASRLWSLARYGKDDHLDIQELLDNANQAGAFVLPQDVRIVYTDVTHAVASKHGVTINFMQSAGPMGKPMIVSRLGMSREHANSLITLLQDILKQEDTAQSQKLLAPPKQNTRRKNSSETDKKNTSQ